MKYWLLGLAAVYIGILYARSPHNNNGKCCSFVQLIHPHSAWQLLRYKVYDNWNFCRGIGQQQEWIASNGLVAHNWMQQAQSNGHCVEMIP